MDEKSVIAFNNCTKRFGRRIILDDISFSIDLNGSFLSIIGKSGSGKTTMIRLLAGLDNLDSGQIFIKNQLVSENKKIIVQPHHRNIGFIFQDLALFPHFTVFENIAFGLKLNSTTDYKSTVNDILYKFKIEQIKDSYPNQISGGQQQLVALARSIALKPDILLMDEPLANLDVKLKRFIRQLVKNLTKENNINVIYVTHDHAEAIELSDKILLLNNKKIEFNGTPEELLSSKISSVSEFIELSLNT